MCQCNEKIELAKRSRFRFITACQHNAVHAHWDNVTLSWRLQDFQRFAEMVQRRVVSGNIPEPSVMLRINQVMVGWQTADFLIFAEMVLEANAGVEHALAYLCQSNKRPVEQFLPHRHLNHKFSLN